MNAYIYQSALLCEDCAKQTRLDLDSNGETPEDVDDESSYDSDDYPKGPYSQGGGESDSPQHCDSCNVFLENDLTDDGEEYVRQMVTEHATNGRGNAEVIAEWKEFYDIRLPDPDDEDE